MAADELPEWERELLERQAQTNALYRERAALVAFLAASYPSEITQDNADEGWWIVYVTTPTGQLPWHVSDADKELFCHVPEGSSATWDGHTTEQKYERLAELTRIVAEIGAMPQRYILGSEQDPLVPLQQTVDEMRQHIRASGAFVQAHLGKAADL